MDKTLIIFCIILLGAAVTDLCQRKVFNCWLFLGVLPGLAQRGLNFFWPLLLLFFPVYLFFRLRLLGAGDGKLIMLIAGTLGLYEGLIAISAGLMLAALWSFVRIFREKSLRMRLLRLFTIAGAVLNARPVDEACLASLRDPDKTIPLAACLAAGTIAFILISSSMGGLLP